jgi:alpha-1,2-mannosyltransferase
LVTGVASGAAAPVRPSKHGRLVLACWLVAVVVATVVVLSRSDELLLDLRIYRAGGRAWLEGLPLYVNGFANPLGGPDFPFTYPPIAAELFSLVALIPWTAAVVVWTGLGLLLFGATCLAAARSVHGRGTKALLIGLGVASAGTVLEPIRETLTFGQINLLLMGLVGLDCLLPRTRWPRGMLIGLAAAIKLTPAIFVLFFLPRRHWRPVITAAASFVGFGLVGLALAPTDAKQYWFSALLDPSRVGDLSYAGNQSLRGVLHRLGLTVIVESGLWALISLGVVVLAWVAVTRARQAGNDLAAVLAVAIAGLLVSPVSWSHHWVWVGPGLVLLAGVATHQSRLWLTAVAPVALVFTVGPQWLLPNDHRVELGWQWWEHLVGDAYVWAGLAALVALAVAWKPQRPASP